MPSLNMFQRLLTAAVRIKPTPTIRKHINPLSHLEELEARVTPTVMPLPSQSSTFSSNVRGYWFTAPTDFVITRLGGADDRKFR